MNMILRIALLTLQTSAHPAHQPRQLALPPIHLPTFPVISPLTIPSLQYIAPTSSSCSTATTYQSECATATEAFPYIVASFYRYNLTSLYAQVAVLSLIAYESGDFKYVRNHFPAPGRPDQGTRNMQSQNYNEAYAASRGLGPFVMVENMMEALTTDEYAWASAAWFLETQCSSDIRNDLETRGRAGWEAYLTDCVGTTVDGGRVAYWQRACAALGVLST